jgi:hypothetical protein
MPASRLDDILASLGRLDDYPGADTGREHFRRYLQDNVTEPTLLRSYIEQCLGRTDEQHGRALRDLVIYLGRFFDFEVIYGPYEWLPGQIGFDGRWTSTWGPHIVLEVKTRETYISQRPTLARRIEFLIVEGAIPSWNFALGLYVIARPGLDVGHLEKQILEEKQAHQLRIIKPESLCTLAELARRDKLTQQDVLTLLRSGGPTADWLVDLVARLAATPEVEREARPGLAEELERFVEDIGKTMECLGDCLVQTLENLFGGPPKSED